MNIAEPAWATPWQVAAPPAVHRRSLAVGVIGPGHVGSALLAQLRAAQPHLAAGGTLDLRLAGIISSRRMWLDCDDPFLDHAGCDPRERRAQTWRPASLAEFARHVQGERGEPALLIDCSASEVVADAYAGWLAAGIHVVTANKLAGSGPLRRWQAVRGTPGPARYRQEATVCAGLPVLGTLHDLLATGDELVAVDGLLSGSLAWLFNHHDGSRPFSTLVREAQRRGYTEPDPRADLTGLDVARKLVILARSAGWASSLEDVQIQPLVPDELAAVPRDAFMARLEELDAPLDALLHRARTEGGVLRHVAHLDKGHARITLDVLPPTHALAHTRQCDNVLQFTTRRYCDNPLLVQGPGAGPEVTAAGVFADVLRIAEALPERP